MSSIYSVKNPQRQPTTPTKQDDDASTMRYTIQVDNAVAAGESHSAFGISSTSIHSQNNIIPMLEKYFKKEMEIWGAFVFLNRVVRNK